MIKIVVRLVSVLAGCLLLATVALPFLILQDERLVPSKHANVFDDVELAKSVLHRLNPQHMDPSRETVVRVTDDEISRTFDAALARILPTVSVVVRNQADGISVSGTADVSSVSRLFGRYLNVQATVTPSNHGLEFSRLSVGSLSVPTWIIRPGAVFLIDCLVGFGKGSAAYDSLRRVEVRGTQLVLTFQPPSGLYDDVKDSVRRFVHRDNMPVIRVYYSRIVEESKRLKGQKQISFSAYMSTLLQLAAERSASNDPVEENRALILALALYFGDTRFGMLLGEVANGVPSDDSFDKSIVRLSGRHDWVQHFVTTAAIQVAAGSDISNFIGEAKEIVDTDGPEGFSFADIAADRTGVQFAHLATRSNADARRLQGLFKGHASERLFFPVVTDLPEGLSASQFKATYGDVGSDAFDRMTTAIDRRISALPICSE